VIDVDEALLIRLAGVRAFGQGMNCFDDGRVSSLETSEQSTRAVVRGGETHEVRLRHTHSIIEGECDCEASGGIDFCQHCVAVALALQEKRSPKKPVAKRRAMTVIRRHLSELSHEVLLDEMMKVVGQDRSLRDDFFQKIQIASGALSYADLKGMISRIELRGEPWEFKKVRAFFATFESFLLSITENVDQLDPIVLLRAVEFAVRRLDGEARFTDEYGDFSEFCRELVFNLHRVAVSRLDWSPAELASYLVDRYLSENWHPVQSDADLYVTDLGDAFQRAILSEIDMRLIEASSSDDGGSESVRDELEALKAMAVVAEC
jgi:hypothetical protein